MSFQWKSEVLILKIDRTNLATLYDNTFPHGSSQMQWQWKYFDQNGIGYSQKGSSARNENTKNTVTTNNIKLQVGDGL